MLMEDLGDAKITWALRPNGSLILADLDRDGSQAYTVPCTRPFVTADIDEAEMSHCRAFGWGRIVHGTEGTPTEKMGWGLIAAPRGECIPEANPRKKR